MEKSMLIAAMVRLDEDKVLALVNRALDNGVSPFDIVEEVRMGMSKVGVLYERGKYFLSDLMMSAEIFKEVIELLRISNIMYKRIDAPPIVIGTVKNDIHDIGKNIMVQLLQCNGFRVVDLGVDVMPAAFVRAVADNSSKVLCMSGLLTVSYEPMKLTVHELEKADLRNGVNVIIGGLVNEQVRQFVRADHCINDSSAGLHICRSLLCPKEHALIS